MESRLGAVLFATFRAIRLRVRGFRLAEGDGQLSEQACPLGIPVGGFNLMTLLVAFGGAVLLLFLLGLIKRRA